MSQFVVTIALALLCGCNPDKPVAPTATVDDKPNTEIPASVRAINDYRAKHGLPALTYSKELTAAAQKHVDDMVNRNFFSHTGSDGSRFSDRARAAGFSMAGGGEIIAQASDPKEAVSDWSQSSGHNAQMLTTQWKYVGAAVGKSRSCAVFGNK
jgi:uncharacterized protein YkwD